MAKVKVYYKHALSGLVASATAGGYEVDNLLIFLEGSLWKGVGTGDHTITFDAGVGKSIGANYIGIANHNLAGATFMLQYSNDNFSGDINDAWDYSINEFATSVFDASATSTFGIGFDLNGTLWICDANTDKIYNVATDGTWISEFPTSAFDASAVSPQGISFAPNGTLWICDSNQDKVYNVKTDGTWISEFATSDFSSFGPGGVGIAPDGTLWICDSISDDIYNVTTDGALIGSFPTSAFDASAIVTNGITVAHDGTLWLCDSATDEIYNVTTDGTLITSFATSIYGAGSTSPQGIGFAQDGTLWICDSNTNKVYNASIPIPIDNKPLLKEFDLISSRYWRIKLSNLSAVPFMAIAYWGLSSVWDYPVLFDPNNETDTADVNISKTGHLLGINARFVERKIRLKFSRVDDGGALWLAIKSWWDNHGLSLLFIAWEIDNHFSDIFFVYPDPKFEAPFITANRREVSLTFKGRV
jgi:sugar lactone lactonase YvrE